MKPDQLHWWLSFVDPTKPSGARFLGVAIVGPAADMRAAIQTAWQLGLNPGGEVEGMILPPSAIAATPPEYRGRLLDRTEAEQLDEHWLRQIDAVDVLLGYVARCRK